MANALSDDIHKRFPIDPPELSPAQCRAADRVRKSSQRHLEVLASVCPWSRELSVALRKWEEADFWARLSIARNADALPPEPAKAEDAMAQDGWEHVEGLAWKRQVDVGLSDSPRHHRYHRLYIKRSPDGVLRLYIGVDDVLEQPVTVPLELLWQHARGGQ